MGAQEMFRCEGKADENFSCLVCVSGGHSNTVLEKEVLLGAVGSLECVDKFCYLGDMISCGGGADDAVRNRVKCAWGKFRELAQILTLRGVSLKLKGKIYVACVQSVMVYGSETWAVKVSNLQQLERRERTMVRWMCGVTTKDGKSVQELLDCLNITGVVERVRRGRLRWFGHVERKSMGDWVAKCRELLVEGVRGRGRGRKSWMECVVEDMGRLHLRREDALDRTTWRSGILGNRPTRACAETRTLNRR